MEPNYDLLNKLAAGSSGSAIAAWLARATGLDLFFHFLGGSFAAWFVGNPIAEHFGLVKLETLIGFAVGFLAIFIMIKLRDLIMALKLEHVMDLLKSLVPWSQKGK